MTMYVCNTCLGKHNIEAEPYSTVANCELCGYLDNQWERSQTVYLVRWLNRPLDPAAGHARRDILQQIYHGFVVMGYRLTPNNNWAKPIGNQAYVASTLDKKLFLLLKGDKGQVLNWGSSYLENFDPRTIAQAETLLYSGLSVSDEHDQGFWFLTYPKQRDWI